MTTYPPTKNEFLLWADAHTDLWIAAASSIGISASQATGYKAKVTDMRERFVAQEQARLNYKAATEAAIDIFRDTRALTSDLVRAIRSYAANTDNPEVYQLAQIPAPTVPGTIPPPGQPTDFRIGLNSDGSITIRWKATHPKGSDRVVYFVQRKLVNESAFTLIGGTGDRNYTDVSLPMGVDGATYIVTAQRGSVQGEPSAQLSVTFGSAGGGGGGLQNRNMTFTESPSTGAMNSASVSPFMKSGKAKKKAA